MRAPFPGRESTYTFADCLQRLPSQDSPDVFGGYSPAGGGALGTAEGRMRGGALASLAAPMPPRRPALPLAQLTEGLRLVLPLSSRPRNAAEQPPAVG